MSVRVMSMVFERYPNGGGERVLALALADHAHDDGSHIFPSVATLAAKSLQSERTVQYQLRKMVEMGWLVLVAKGGGRNRPAEYRISQDWINGAKIAPFQDGEKGCNPEHETVQSGAETVQSDALKGATAIAPEPSITINNHQEPPRAHEAADEKQPGKTRSENQNATAILRRFGIPPELAASFVRVRNKKNLAITNEAMLRLRREGEKLKLTLAQAVTICCETGWGSINAGWPEAQNSAREIRQRENPDAVAHGAQKPSAEGDWRDSPGGVRRRGSELGIEPKPGESDAAFKTRVLAANSERQRILARQYAERFKSMQAGGVHAQSP